MLIENLSRHTDFIPVLASWHFKQWRYLTGASTEADYKAFFLRNASVQNFPITLIAVSHDRLLGSASLIDCDMDIRCELKPWLAQLFVEPSERGKGIGAALVHAVIERGRKLGFDSLYLYTSGTLPSFYERLGWTKREAVHYKGKERFVMEISLRG